MGKIMFSRGLELRFINSFYIVELDLLVLVMLSILI